MLLNSIGAYYSLDKAFVAQTMKCLKWKSRLKRNVGRKTKEKIRSITKDHIESIGKHIIKRKISMSKIENMQKKIYLKIMMS